MSTPTPARVSAASVVLAVLPIAVATVRAIRRGWIPIGDNALFLIRSRDVLTSHHPLVGTWTSASRSLGESINNPGPLLFDLLALPAKLGGAAGVAIGVALVNTGAVLGIALFARRHGGPVAVTAAMVMCAGLAWTMGSELLFDPWQPNSLLFPFLFFIVLVWALFARDLAALPWTAAVASLILQTHLSYSVLVPVLCLLGLCAAVLRLRPRRRAVRIVALTIALVAVLWLQPVVEQAQGDGNLGAIATSVTGGDEPSVGGRLGTRLTASVVAFPPFWARPSFARTLDPLERTSVPSLGVSLVSLGLLVTVLAIGAIAGRRRPGDARAAAFTALVAVGLSLATAVLLPRGGFDVPAHQLRWLWPVGLFAAFAIIIALANRLPASTEGPLVGGLLSVTAVLAVLALPAYNAKSGPSADAHKIPATKRLIAQLRDADLRGPVLFDVGSLQFAEPYSVSVMAELQRQGVEFRLDEEGWIDQLGHSRRFNGDAVERIVQLQGDGSLDPPSGGRLLGRVDGLSPPHKRELDTLRDAISRYVSERGLRLNRAGVAAEKRGDLPRFAEQGQVATDAPPLLDAGEFDALVAQRLVVIDPEWTDRFERFARLHRQWSAETVALYLAPVDR